MKVRTAIALGIFSLAAAPSAWADDDHFRRLSADLTGYEETPLTVSTGASGRFKARITNHDTAIDYELSYGELEGTVTQAHIHIGQRAITGGIVVFLCTNVGGGTPSTPACPQSGTVTGTLTAADLTPNANAQTQGFDQPQFPDAQFAELLRAIRAGATYVNVHSTRWPGGEIRDQLGKSHGRDHDD